MELLGDWANVVFWFVLGVALVIADLALAGATFYLLMFGVGAILTSLVAFVLPSINAWAQAVIWLLLSLAVLLTWLKFFRSSESAHGGTEELVGETGIVTKTLGRSGSVRFQKPLAGKDQWDFESEKDIEGGSRIRVVKVTGNGKVLVEAAGD